MSFSNSCFGPPGQAKPQTVANPNPVIDDGGNMERGSNEILRISGKWLAEEVEQRGRLFGVDSSDSWSIKEERTDEDDGRDGTEQRN